MAISTVTTKRHQQKSPQFYGEGPGQASGDLGVAPGGLCTPNKYIKGNSVKAGSGLSHSLLCSQSLK